MRHERCPLHLQVLAVLPQSSALWRFALVKTTYIYTLELQLGVMNDTAISICFSFYCLYIHDTVAVRVPYSCHSVSRIGLKRESEQRDISYSFCILRGQARARGY